MANEKRPIDFEKARKSVMEILAGKVTTLTAIKVSCAMQEAAVDAIVPPVNIGQILWCSIPHSELPLECRVYSICREERNGLILDYFRCTVKGWFGKAFSFEDVGKTIFLTEAEALAKMDGGNEDG